MKLKWSEWKKRIFIILASLVFFLMVVLAIQLFLYYQEERNYEAAHAAYAKIIPNDISSYPLLKRDVESLDADYDQVMQDSGFYDPVFESRVTVAVLNCRGLVDDIENFKRDGLASFDQEIDLEHYQSIDGLKWIIGTIPSISDRFKSYTDDKTLTYKEYCSLAAMLNLWVEYKDELSKKDLKNSIKNNLS